MLLNLARNPSKYYSLQFCCQQNRRQFEAPTCYTLLSFELLLVTSYYFRDYYMQPLSNSIKRLKTKRMSSLDHRSASKAKIGPNFVVQFQIEPFSKYFCVFCHIFDSVMISNFVLFRISMLDNGDMEEQRRVSKVLSDWLV